MAEPSLDLAIQFALKGDLPSRADFRRWAKAALKTDVVASLRLVDQAEGRELNRDYRGKDYATNVLTFAYGAVAEGQPLTGDIVLCVPVVEREAEQQGKRLPDHYAHLTIHALLHLQGYDHERRAEAVTMEALESFIMQKLGLPDPYRA